jgi:hypothetical protein
MQSKRLFQISRPGLKICKYRNVKSWVAKAITEEELKPNTQLWRKEPTQEFQYNERLRRIKFLRKHLKSDPSLQIIIDRLERCKTDNRCFAGACPECGRLLQRWFVRKSKKLIRDEIENPDQQLVAISIIPSTPIVRPGKLRGFSISNMQRRLKYALDKIGLAIAIGAFDFSFNEDRDGKYQPFLCIHPYLVTSISNKTRIKRLLKQIFKPDGRIPRPIKISDFNNCAWRRSYAFKIRFECRIGHNALKQESDGNIRRCRDTSRGKLRSSERLELFKYLDQIGFHQRFIFCGIKPITKGGKVVIRKTQAFECRIKPNPKKLQKMPKNR